MKSPPKIPLTIKAFLFDVDGTIFNVEQEYRSAYQKALIKSRVPHDAPETFWRDIGACFGTPEFEASDCMVKVANRYNYCLSLSGKELTDIKTKIMNKRLQEKNNNIQIIDGIMECINKAFQRSPKGLGVCSGTCGSFIGRLLSQFKIRKHFSAEVFIDDPEMVGKTGKPDPLSYKLLSKRLGVDAHKCCVFEDTPIGAISALRFGVPLVFVRPSYLSLEQVNDQLLETYGKRLESIINKRLFILEDWWGIELDV